MKNLLLFIFFLIVHQISFAQTFSNGTNMPITDNNAANNSTIAVSGLNTNMSCATPLVLQTVCIKISHTYDSDLDIYLISPAGTSVMLSTDNGAGGDHYGNATADDNGPYTCFDMSAATNITAGAAPFAGSYIPEASFAAFNTGQNPNGNWTLRIFDDTGADVGTLLYWQLTFGTTSPVCPTAPNCATYTAPLDGAEFCGTSTTLTWAPGSGSAPTSYILYYGTDNPPTNIVNGVNIGNVTTYPVAGLTVGTSYFWQIIPTNAAGNAVNCSQAAFTPIPCINMTNGSSTTCSSNFYDSGGPSGSAADNEFFTYTFCPAIAGQCIQSTFYTFNTESGYDLLYVYNGNSVAAPQLPGSPFSGNLGAFVVGGTSTNATGCLTFRYDSDGSTFSSGWDASITCAPCGTTTLTAQDCGGAIPICNDQSFSANSLGDGIVNDLNATNRGCLSVEHQTSWYYFQVATGGTIQLDITPANGVDDYDFAIYNQGMATALTCPPATSPYRCSYSSLGGVTGLDLTAGDNTEGVGGDKWVEEMVVVAGEVYVMVIDNYSISSQPFTLDWTFTNGATLDCTPLPTELVTFIGKQNEKLIELEWITATEVNNDYFIIEKSSDGINFVPFKTEDGAGLSTQLLNYKIIDENPFNGNNYYKLSQVDYNGHKTHLSLLNIEFKTGDFVINNLHPNPTNGEMYFDFYSTSNGSMKLEIIDITGRVVNSKILNASEGKNSFTVPSNEISNGVYYLKMDFENGKHQEVFKIIKE